jgi:hypothetical protein
MRIDEIHRTLCELYGLQNSPDINPYLRKSIEGEYNIEVGSGSSNREMLLIRENGGYLEMGLFIDPSIISTIDSTEPLDHLDELSCAIEGVSHFIYVMDRVQKGVSVSKLELELQAEVDKFLIIHLIMEGKAGYVPPQLFEQLFHEFKLSEGLSPEEAKRYTTANHFAAKYCAYLRERYFNPLRICGLVSKARDFFSRDLGEKLSPLTP